MKRLTAASLSLAWAAFFATAAWLCMLVAEDGMAATAAFLGLPSASETVTAFASPPVMAGLSFGSSVVAALFATVFVSSVLNGGEDIRQGRFIADMGFGGGFGLTGLSAAALLAQAAFGPALGAVLAGGALLASFFAIRAAMEAGEAPAVDAPIPARWLARDAAAQINVVRFPVERVAGARS